MKMLELTTKNGKLVSVQWVHWPENDQDQKSFIQELHQLNKLSLHQDVYKNATPFQAKVWKACSKIPAGKTKTYKEIANVIGHPKAVRAVGTALGKNPVPFKIPCHRVLNTSGKLGGYSCKFGLKAKKLLLTMEGA